MATFVAPLHFDKSMIVTDLGWPQSPYPAHRPDVPSHWFTFLIALNIYVSYSESPASSSVLPKLQPRDEISLAGIFAW